MSTNPPKRLHADRIDRTSKITIVMRDTGEPYAEIEPGWNKDIGIHVSVYRCLVTGGREQVFTFNIGAIGALIRWLPLCITQSRRIERDINRAAKPKKPG